VTSRGRLTIVTWLAIAVLAVVLGRSYLEFADPTDTARASLRPTASPPASASASATAPAGGPSDVGTPTPDPSIRCTPETGAVTGSLAVDPCPGAVAAVRAAVASGNAPVDRMVIEPGPFFCDEVWLGVGTPRVCAGPGVQPGQYMHAWVAFRGSSKVAAVMLGLDMPENPNAPGATRPPWHATLVRLEVPPAGWVMP
jgi:hypothetical protein